MSRIKRLVRPESEPAQWKLALPILALALSAAVYAQAGTAAPAADAPPVHRNQYISLQSDIAEPYAFVRGGDHGISMAGNDADLDAIKRLQTKIDGDFLWFRTGDKSYVVRDPAVLARARAAWEPLDALNREMEGYNRQMSEHDKSMQALGKEMEKASAGMQMDKPKTQALERQMQDVGNRMGDIGSQMVDADDAERARLERQMADLQRQMTDLTRQMSALTRTAAQRAAEESIKEIGQRMHEAGKPMHALAEQMGTLGRKMGRESRAAEKTVRALIHEAQAKGLAQPVPQV
jgi:predicted  nucleic acid-binding Zn-ribbon protein